MELMPFNFDRLPNGRVFISNLQVFIISLVSKTLLIFLMSEISSEQSNVLESSFS